MSDKTTTKTTDFLKARPAMSQGELEKAKQAPPARPRGNPIEEAARAEMLLKERLEMSPAMARLSGMIEGHSWRGGPPAIMIGIDATASRAHVWEMAKGPTRAMFEEAAAKGLMIKLGFYRGGECQIGKRWMTAPQDVARVMDGIKCVSGATQICKLLSGVVKESYPRPQGLIFIGDAFEEQLEAALKLATAAFSIGTRVHMFHEGDNKQAEQAFRETAAAGGGIFAKFEPGAEKILAELWGAIAAHAVGGRQALEAKGGAGARRLLEHLKGG
jgi:hypothetical protein